MLLLIVIIVIIWAYDKFMSLEERSLTMAVAMLALISVVTNLVIIFKIYHADSKTRPWVAKLEAISTEMAWAIQAWRQYGAPALELIKGLRIFQIFYKKITGRDVDLHGYVREVQAKAEEEIKAQKPEKEPEVEVWRRKDVKIDVTKLCRPHERNRSEK